MSDSTFNLDDLIPKLARMLEETGLNEIEYAEGDKRVRCAKGMPPVVETAGVAVTHQVAGGGAHAPAPAILGTPVASPMVGTVYLSPEPGKPAFVKKGDTVKEGDTLLVIEAMKVMNPIKAPVSGTIADILVGDAKPVEFGETLIVIA